MKYLFVYEYSGIKNGMPMNGKGSIMMTATGNQVTEKLIYDEENGALSIAKRNITDIDDLKLIPIGWFKFDDDGKETI